ncbi:hypothetical protein CU669_01545 [Paramagnetospirillum kuznetsovii]|uniref:Uncharacterized protein n=1 Tax=Paramagnetospirillum kuznetsovii TaxID=2053833 RepID=A0A364P371_9PROT|nr:hypothetical protein [Paramagnetospirillum kuznetsovii]RAU23799.1 hypothetical protein CU669_01545 [Paramagnetospirillum kuznetsovii]
MRWLVVLVAILVIAASPAWTAEWDKPGSSDWPPIPGNVGMTGFLGEWDPQCNNGAYLENGRMTVHADGRIGYALKNPYLPTQYRLIEETAYYVLLMVRSPPVGKYGESFGFAIFRPEGKFGDPIPLRLHTCWPEQKELSGFSWNDGDQGARRVWQGSKSCNPALRKLTEREPFFGEGVRGWDQPCNYDRPIR